MAVGLQNIAYAECQGNGSVPVVLVVWGNKQGDKGLELS